MSVTEIEPDIFGAAKQVAESRLPDDVDRFKGASLETDCPGCARHVHAFIKDGPDPVFVDLACPQCAHEWSERVA